MTLNYINIQKKYLFTWYSSTIFLVDLRSEWVCMLSSRWVHLAKQNWWYSLELPLIKEDFLAKISSLFPRAQAEDIFQPKRRCIPLFHKPILKWLDYYFWKNRYFRYRKCSLLLFDIDNTLIESNHNNINIIHMYNSIN